MWAELSQVLAVDEQIRDAEATETLHMTCERAQEWQRRSRSRRTKLRAAPWRAEAKACAAASTARRRLASMRDAGACSGPRYAVAAVGNRPQRGSMTLLHLASFDSIDRNPVINALCGGWLTVQLVRYRSHLGHAVVGCNGRF